MNQIAEGERRRGCEGHSFAGRVGRVHQVGEAPSMAVDAVESSLAGRKYFGGNATSLDCAARTVTSCNLGNRQSLAGTMAGLNYAADRRKSRIGSRAAERKADTLQAEPDRSTHLLRSNHGRRWCSRNRCFDSAVVVSHRSTVRMPEMRPNR